MWKKVLSLLFVLFLTFSTSLVLASIYTCDSFGNEKTSFYTNDTIYITSNTNITNESKIIKFYVLNHNSWSFGMNLSVVAIFSKNVNTNASGHLPLTILWGPTLTVGDYDMIADMNGNATFDSEDLLYNAAGNGFSIIGLVPELKISKDEKSPSDHDFYETNSTLPNEMLQVKLETRSYEGISVRSFYLLASGNGDDKNGVRYVAVCIDKDKDGTCEFGEEIVGFGQYIRDDGIAKIELKGLNMAENSSLSLVFYYFMRNSSGSYDGKTYSFQLVAAEAFGLSTGNRAIVNGLPIQSSVKTVYSEALATTTSTTTTSTTTTIPPITTIPEERKETSFFVSIAVAIFVVLALMLIFYFFFLKSLQV